MLMQELMQCIEMEDQRIKERYPGVEHHEMIVARTVKLSAEVGQLSDNILASINLQRKQKPAEFNNQSMHKEFADMIITAFLLARSANIDIAQALEEKIPELNKRA